MSDSEAIVRDLYQRGQDLRDRQWRAYEQALARVLTSLEQQEAFVSDFEHLVPQATSAPIGEQHSQQPPPLPLRGGPEAFRDAFGRYPEPESHEVLEGP